MKGVTTPVIVTAPSGKTTSVTLAATEPGLARGSVKTDELGLYRLSDGEHSVLVNVGPENPREYQEVVSTTDKLKPLADSTGGSARRIGTGSGDEIVMPRIVALHDASSYAGADYIGIRRTDSSTVAGIGLLPLATGFIGLLALLGSTVLAWVAEGRGLRLRRRR